MKSLAGFVMRGPMQATLVAAVGALLSFLLPPLTYLSGAAVGLVTLRLGPLSGLKVAGFATVAVAVLGWLVLGNPLPGPAVLLVLWLPIWVLGVNLRRTVSLDRALLLAGMFGAALVVGIHGATGDAAAWWQELMAPYLEQSGAGAEMEAMLAEASAVMTGFAGAAVAVSLSLTLLLARWWQALLFNVGGFQAEFHELRFDRRLTVGVLALLIGAGLLPGEAGQVAGDLALTAMALFLLQGIAVIHGLVKRAGISVGWLVGMYALMLFALPQAVVMLALVGLADTWFDLRKFLGNRQE